jgi:hypothetical protein
LLALSKGNLMPRKRGWRALWLMTLGLACGIGLGLWIGWSLAPVEYVDTDLSYLHPLYQDDVLLMISETYVLDGDLDAARARIALLSLADPPDAVADLAERFVSQDAPLAHVRALAHMSAALGVRRDALRPYLPVTDETR